MQRIVAMSSCREAQLSVQCQPAFAPFKSAEKPIQGPKNSRSNVTLSADGGWGKLPANS